MLQCQTPTTETLKKFLSKEKTRISTPDTRKRLIETKTNDQIDFSIGN